MNIQIYGKSKSFDTKKAERYFKERRISFQSIDLPRYGLSRKELLSVERSVGLDELPDENHRDYARWKYLAYRADKLEMLYNNPDMLRAPIVRNGAQATVGYRPEVWKTWE